MSRDPLNTANVKASNYSDDSDDDDDFAFNVPAVPIDIWNPESVTPINPSQSRRGQAILTPIASNQASPIADADHGENENGSSSDIDDVEKPLDVQQTTNKRRIRIIPLTNKAVDAKLEFKSNTFSSEHVKVLRDAFAAISNTFKSIAENDSTLPSEISSKKPFKKTGYLLFRVQKAKELKANGTKTSVKELGEMWSNLTRKEKLEYIEIAQNLASSNS
ncbi:hypothetical protein BDR26DRAFT_862483 [Obelidium mucronatum]|nr:hypothetical protein BDR26DRAFT_862483 [Obelidium mucronatum]